MVPAVLIVVSALHFWRVRKAKGVVIPRRSDEAVDDKPVKVLFLPNLLTREAAVACVLVAVVVLISVFCNAPLGAEANPGMSPNPAKAPWYFLGFQELLLHFHPVIAVVLIPLRPRPLFRGPALHPLPRRSAGRLDDVGQRSAGGDRRGGDGARRDTDADHRG